MGLTSANRTATMEAPATVANGWPGTFACGIQALRATCLSARTLQRIPNLGILRNAVGIFPNATGNRSLSFDVDATSLGFFSSGQCAGRSTRSEERRVGKEC